MGATVLHTETDNLQALEIQSLMAQANEARTDYENAAREYRGLAHRESELEAQRSGQKHAAILRLMARQNDLTGRQHSASSAEATVELDHDYAAHLAFQREVVAEKNHAHTRMASAKLRCDTAVAVIRAIAGLI